MKTPKEVLYRSSKKTALQAADLASNTEAFFEQLLELSLSKDYPYSWRASWALLYLSEQHPSRVVPHLKRIADSLESLENHTQVGSMLRIFDHMEFDLEDFGNLLDFCLHTIRMPQKGEYVKVIAMSILLRFAKTYPELAPEIKEQVGLAKASFEGRHVKRKGKDLLSDLDKLA